MKVFRGSAPPKDSPQAHVLSAIASFCDTPAQPSQLKGLLKKSKFGFGSSSPSETLSGGDGKQPSSNTITPHQDISILPMIIEYAESTPDAAKEAVRAIQKRLDVKNLLRTSSQYNAVMVLRLLIDTNSPMIIKQIGLNPKLPGSLSGTLNQTRDPSVKESVLDFLIHISTEHAAVPEFDALRGIYANYQAKHSTRSQSHHTSSHPSQTHRKTDPADIQNTITEAKEVASLARQMLIIPGAAETDPLASELITRCRHLFFMIQSFLTSDSASEIAESQVSQLVKASEDLSDVITLSEQPSTQSSRAISNYDVSPGEPITLSKTSLPTEPGTSKNLIPKEYSSPAELPQSAASAILAREEDAKSIRSAVSVASSAGSTALPHEQVLADLTSDEDDLWDP
ncbi:uncharacterized protein V1516DRAFT_682270 [Lipomyces oligophaga]|uniref:uncharacterized protein n=1 Tax=Lipomyces oligophaga TaxID=45792 RepID=UPI0034CDFC9C